MATIRLGQLKGPAGFCRLVAIKQLNTDLADHADGAAMLVKEAQLNAAINHPNVVRIIDVVEQGGEFSLVMDYVDGETLSLLLRRSRKQERDVPIGVAVRIAIDLLDGLHAAHTATDVEGVPLGVVHRDVSPQNVMIGADGVGRVLDFGVAKAALGASYTIPGKVRGKLAYMAPEQLRGEPVDARCDVFATGVVLWEMLSGRRMLSGDWLSRSTPGHGEASASSPCERREVPAALNASVRRALARDKAARFPSAREFADALEAAFSPASRSEVAVWVGAIAAPEIEQRRRLATELDQGTVPVLVLSRSPSPGPNRVKTWLFERRRALGATVLAALVGVVTALFWPTFADGARQQNFRAVAPPPLDSGVPVERAPSEASALGDSVDASSLTAIPIRPESLPLEAKAPSRPSAAPKRRPGRVRGAPARAAVRRPSASDVLGF
jgi:serine/threonine-protein kinase